MSNRRVVFVNVPSPFLLSDKGAPPLGMLYLSSACREAGFESVVVDLTGNASVGHQLGCDAATFITRESFWVPELMADLDRHRDIVALSVTSAQYGAAQNLLLALKWTFGDIPVIIGGPHVSALPGEALASGFDTVFTGEADTALVDWLKAGATFNGIVHSQAPRDLDVLPLPARDLVDLGSYCANLTVGEGCTSTIVTSRGCPYRCRYCVRTLGDAARVLRVRDPAPILTEIRALDETYGLRRFVAVDDLWGIPRAWTAGFCQVFAGLGYHFRVNCRANTVHDDLLPAMKRAGIDVISFGFESGSDRILESISKNTVECNTKAVHACHDAGIAVKAYLIFGFAGDDRESLEATQRWVETARPDSCQASWLVPLPGTPLYDEALCGGWQPAYHELYHLGRDKRGSMNRLPWHTDETAQLYEELCEWLEAFYATPQPAVECPNALSDV